jgi:hypothetical protein
MTDKIPHRPSAVVSAELREANTAKAAAMNRCVTLRAEFRESVVAEAQAMPHEIADQLERLAPLLRRRDASITEPVRGAGAPMPARPATPYESHARTAARAARFYLLRNDPNMAISLLIDAVRQLAGDTGPAPEMSEASAEAARLGM